MSESEATTRTTWQIAVYYWQAWNWIETEYPARLVNEGRMVRLTDEPERALTREERERIERERLLQRD